MSKRDIGNVAIVGSILLIMPGWWKLLAVPMTLVLSIAQLSTIG